MIEMVSKDGEWVLNLIGRPERRDELIAYIKALEESENKLFNKIAELARAFNFPIEDSFEK